MTAVQQLWPMELMSWQCCSSNVLSLFVPSSRGGKKAECMYEVFGACAPLLTVLSIINLNYQVIDEQRVEWTGSVTLTVKSSIAPWTRILVVKHLGLICWPYAIRSERRYHIFPKTPSSPLQNRRRSGFKCTEGICPPGRSASSSSSSTDFLQHTTSYSYRKSCSSLSCSCCSGLL